MTILDDNKQQGYFCAFIQYKMHGIKTGGFDDENFSKKDAYELSSQKKH